jgi:hypothetical protein
MSQDGTEKLPCGDVHLPGPAFLLRIPDRILSVILAANDSGNICGLEASDLSSTPRKLVSRGGTRIPCEIPITLTCLNPADPFTEPCKIILANLRGGAARSPRPVPTGSPVVLHGLPVKPRVGARVVNCISLGEYEKLWILGLSLDEPGNVWGIESVPDDWEQS